MNNVLELRQLWQIIRKHFLSIVVMAIIGAAAGFGIERPIPICADKHYWYIYLN